MRFGQSLLRKIAMALAMVVPAMAADVAPLYFQGATDDQAYWDELMSFKMWGTNGIEFGHATMTDLSGAVGTAGDLHLNIEKHTIGGPIFVGGNVYGSNGGDTLMSGPVRVKGDFTAGQNGSRYNGTYCIEGTANDNLKKYSHSGGSVQPREEDEIYGRVYSGDDAKAGDCAYDVLKDVPTHLTIPLIPDHEYAPAITVRGQNLYVKNSYGGDSLIGNYIDVPPLSEGKLQDFYIEKISFENDATLIIRMESAKSLTRIFLNENINVSSQTNIKIVYVDSDAKFVDGKWTNVTSMTQVDNEDYAGNLLFYMKGDMTWPSMNKGTSEQGTFISQGKITVGANLRLAGQFLANSVEVGHEFDGTGFRYVPFDPPVLNLEPEVGTKLEFPENGVFVKVPIKLDEFPKVNVYFNYCFEVLSGSGAASLEDFGEDENGVYQRPLCSQGQVGKVAIMAGAKSPADGADVSAWIKVLMDDEIEGNETLRFVIKDLSGAVMPGDKREGFFDLILVDSDLHPKTKDDSIHVVEDSPYTFATTKFAYQGVNAQKGVAIRTLPTKGYLLLDGDTVTTAMIVNLADIEDGKLQYINEKDEYNGSKVYATFTFGVIDIENNATEDKDIKTMSIYVQPVNDAPFVAESQEMSVDENAKNGSVVETFIATDVDGDVLTYAFDKDDANYATVSSIFAIDSKTGVVTVKDGSKLDFESGVTSYTINVKVTDDASTTGGSNVKTSTGSLTINVNDVNEEHVVKNIVWSITEGETYGSYPSGFGNIKDSIVDPDSLSAIKAWKTYSYVIVENQDEDKTNDVPFYLNAKTGVMKIENDPSVKIDFETNPQYTFHVLVKDSVKNEDGSYGQYEYTALVTVNVEDVNEAPEFGKVKGSYAVDEHTPGGELFDKIPLIDQDSGEFGKDGGATVELVDNSPVEGAPSAADLFDVSFATAADGKTYVALTVKDVKDVEKLLDYEALYESHFVADSSAVLFDVTVNVTDKGGLTVSTTTKIKVVDINEEPTAQDDTFEVAEYTENGAEGSSKEGDFVGQVVASDPDTKNPDFGTLYYSIVENTDADKTNDVPFTVTEDGKILVGKDADRLNLEGDEATFVIHVAVTDGVIDEPKIATITINLTNVNEPPTITDDGKDWNINEHVAKGTVVSGQNLVASDADKGDALTYSMTDASGIFTIDPSTGKVSVKDSVKLDYELYAKSEKEKVSFEVTVTATDKDGEKVSINKTIVINDVNEDPSTKDDAFEVAEFTGVGEEGSAKEGDFVGQVTAADPDTRNADFGTLYYSIVENTDADKTNDVPFTVTEDGKILVGKDVERLNLEGDEASFVIHVAVTDGVIKEPKIAEITISLTNVNENPVITDDGKDWNINEHVAKGTVVSGQNLTASDPDAGDALTFSMTDASGIFTIDPSTGKVSVKDSVKLDYELYAKSEKEKVSFDVTIVVTDADGKTASKKKTIVINDVNEDPSTKNDSFEVAEFTGIGEEGSSKEGDFVGQVTATDPDTKNADFGTLYYSIVENTDADKTNDVPFTVTADGKILVGKDVERLNLEGDEASFVIHVAVTDGVIKEPKIAEITISLTNVNEPPTIADDGKDWNINEHVAKGSVVVGQNLTASDSDEGDALTFSMTDASGIFTIDPVTGKVSVKDSVKLDYELYAKSEKEKVSFEVTVTVADKDGRTDAVKKTIVINDVNEAPKFEEPNVPDVGELRKNGDVVATVVANEPDAKNVEFRHLEYTILTPNMPMAMDSNKVVVTDASKFDFETNPKFNFEVEVKNCLKNATTGKYTESCLADTVEVTLGLFDEDEKPEIIPVPDPECDENDPDCHKCDATIADCGHIDVPPPSDCVENCGYAVKDTIYINVKENSPAGTVILEYLVKDEDKDEVTKLIPTFESVNKSGADSLFDISLEKKGDDYKIVLKVAEGADLDYEKVNELHKLVITVTDPTGLKDDIFRVIKVVDVNEPPFIVKQEFDFDEHNEAGSTVGKIVWGDDWDTKEPSFRDNKVELVGGDTEKFDVDPTGLITTKVPFNYETNDSVYTLVVKVVDKNDPTLFVVDTMTIKLNNVPETPYITSTEFEIPENPKNKEVIGVITSEDLDDLENKDERVYTLVGTSDYVTVTEDGKILVKDSTKFDFEKVESIKINVKVTDPQGETSDTTIVINIKDENEEPTIEDQTITVSEDAAPNTVIDTLVASDPDIKSKDFGELTYTIVGGDTAVFKVDPKTGEVILKDSLDYEKKKEYELVVEVSDGTYSDTAKVTIKVDNVDEKSVVEITQVCDSDSCRVKPDSVFTHIPDITICWNEGREICEKSKCTVLSKEVCQDTTLTEGIHTIVKEFKDPSTDVPGFDTVVVFVSTSTPIVTVSANTDSLDAANIYTVEESLDENDSNIYVNSSTNDIRVTIKDPVTKKDSSFVVKLELDTLNVGKKDLETVTSVVEKGSVSLNLNPTGTVTHTPVNGTEVKVSYTEEVNGKKVTVSYVTDNAGEVVKTPVYDEKGNVDSIEVITVSYEITLGGKKVTVSYQADAITGQALNVAADGSLTTAEKLVVAGSNGSSDKDNTSSGKPGSSDNGGKPGSSSSNGSKPGSSTSAGSSVGDEIVQNVGSYKVTYDYVDEKGNSVVVTYTIDEDGNIVKNGEGDIGYTVSYTYVNKFGNSATQSVFIVLDQVGPKVEILAPTHMQVIRSNFVEVTWTVNGVVQDTLTLQGLEKGPNWIARYYRDKAGNEARDSVLVIMKDGKDVDLAVEQPVVEITKEKVEEYYAVNPPKEGEKVAISIRNPSTGKEVETLIAGTFGTEDGSGDTPYPGVSGDTHLGPTLSMEVRLPVVNDVGGLATLDDLVGSDGLISLDGVDAKDAEKVSVEEYVDTYCKEGFKFDGDFSRVNLYKSKMIVQVWIYTTLGNFVDYYTFKQDLNDPDFTNEAGMLEMYMELKPDREGEVHTEDGHVLATGAYLYKVDAKIRAELQCTLPPVKDQTTSAKKKGDVIKKSDEMLKSFGYKRPNKK